MHRAAVILLFCAGYGGSALAHPNHAGGSPLGAGLLHLLTEPDHLAAIVLPLLVVAVAVTFGTALMHRKHATAINIFSRIKTGK